MAVIGAVGPRRAVLVVLALAGCTPPPPFLLAETAETLPARALSVGLSGGGGGGGGSSTVAPVGGAVARVRVGVGHRQEVGVEGGAYLSGDGRSVAGYGMGKLTWKMQLLQHAAVLSGVGFSTIGSTVGLGGELGGVSSSGPLRGAPVQLYGGVRAFLVVPAARDPYASGITGGGALALGLAYAPAPAWRLWLELGGVGGGSVSHGALNPPSGRAYAGWAGGYGALAVSHAWIR